MFAGAIFLEIAAAHHHDGVVFIFENFLAPEVKAIDLGVPEFKDPSEKSFRLAYHDVVAAVAPLLAIADLLIGWGDQPTGHFLHRDIEQHEGEEEKANGPADPAWQPLLRDAQLR